MNTYAQQKASEMEQAIRTGRELKDGDRMGKEYYAFYNIKNDTILEWVEVKVKELVGQRDNQFVSIVGITHYLANNKCFKVSNSDLSLIYVHKKRFKRFVKKAVQHNLSRG